MTKESDQQLAMQIITRAFEEGSSDLDLAAVFVLAAVLNPNDLDALNALTVRLCKQGEYQKALPLCQKLAQCAPESAIYQFNLGICFERLGQHEQALECMRTATNLDPEDADFRNAFNELLGALQKTGNKKQMPVINTQEGFSAESLEKT